MKTGETGQMKDKKKLAAAGILAVVLALGAGCSGRPPQAGSARYEVEFTAAGVEYDYELDASDGRILSADSEVIDKGYRASQNGTTGSQNAAGTSQTTPGGVSIETAKQTVMDRIPGIDAGNIYIHPDYDDGISLYEGEAYYAEVKYEFEINAENGNIISWEAESIYD